VYDVDAASGATKALRNDPRPGMSGLAGIDASIDKAPAHDGQTIPLNVYLPKPRPKGPMPVIVDVHGGPAANAKIGWSAFIRFMVAQGYAVVEPNIRGSTGFGRAYELADNREKRGDALKDMESVNTWVKAQTWADKDRVIIYGGSYGGYMTLLALSRQPTLWRAGVDLVGIANLVSFLQSTSGDIRAAFVDEFGDLDKDRALLEEWSPIKNVDKIVSPLFVYQGQNDPRVPRPESDLIVSALRGRNVPVEYMVVANEGHSLDRRESRLAFMSRVVRFLADQTGKPASK
jgi:dipeptidyl aminopeptidase/acylaminoacyl peptidase